MGRRHDADNSEVRINQKNSRGMIDAIVITAVRNFHEKNAKFTRKLLEFLDGGGYADKVLVKVVYVRTQGFGRVAIGIDRNKNDLADGAVTVVCLEIVMSTGEQFQGGGADIRAAGETEKQECPFTAQAIESKRGAVVIDQVNRADYRRVGP